MYIILSDLRNCLKKEFRENYPLIHIVYVVESLPIAFDQTFGPTCRGVLN